MKNYAEYIGQRFGRLTVIGFIPSSSTTKEVARFQVRCDCGKEKIVSVYAVLKGVTQSCGCLKRERARTRLLSKGNKPKKDITGQVFGHLTAISYIGQGRWLWQCDCGEQKIINASNVKNGKTVSCGHYHRNRLKDSIASNFGLRDNTNLSKIRITVSGKLRRNNTTGVTGVYTTKTKIGTKYHAQIKVCGKQISLGVFNTLEEAAHVRHIAEEKYFRPLLSQCLPESETEKS